MNDVRAFGVAMLAATQQAVVGVAFCDDRFAPDHLVPSGVLGPLLERPE